MTFRAKFGWAAAAVSAIVNAGGAVYALRFGEWMHAGLHVVLLALTLYLVALVRPRAVSTIPELEEPLQPVTPEALRMEQLQQSVDAIAIEVERIGEAQRYNAKLQANQAETSGPRR